jgi:hypothetical protein
MAEGFRFVCDECAHAIEAWDDGNPYYIDDDGKKQYAYHPSGDRDRCIGNDSPHLCLSCGSEFMVDSNKGPVIACPKCEVNMVVDTMGLGGKSCPYCKKGVFRADPGFHPIS